VLTGDGIPAVDGAKEIEFSTLIRIEHAKSEVAAFLILETATGGTIRYALPSPEQIARPGRYCLTVTLNARELGCSLFHVTLTTLTARPQSPAETKQLERDGSFIVAREASMAARAKTPAAMEIEQAWYVR
jgi:hypothetical protein